jgi:hypothetical protein
MRAGTPPPTTFNPHAVAVMDAVLEVHKEITFKPAPNPSTMQSTNSFVQSALPSVQTAEFSAQAEGSFQELTMRSMLEKLDSGDITAEDLDILMRFDS